MKYLSSNSLVAGAICLMASATPASAGLSLGATSSDSGGLTVGVPQVHAGASVSGNVKSEGTVGTGANLDAANNLNANVTTGDDADDNNGDSVRGSFRAEENAHSTNDISVDPSTNRGHKKRHHIKKPGATQKEIHDHATGLENRADAGVEGAGGSSAVTTDVHADVNSDIKAAIPDVGVGASHHSDAGLKTDYNQ